MPSDAPDTVAVLNRKGAGLVIMVDVFDEIKARHEGRIMRLRNMPAPEPRYRPERAWYQRRKRRADRHARQYDACVLAGWWEAEQEILFNRIMADAS